MCTARIEPSNFRNNTHLVTHPPTTIINTTEQSLSITFQSHSHVHSEMFLSQQRIERRYIGNCLGFNRRETLIRLVTSTSTRATVRWEQDRVDRSGGRYSKKTRVDFSPGINHCSQLTLRGWMNHANDITTRVPFRTVHKREKTGVPRQELSRTVVPLAILV